jgi:two-component system response regulator HydG
MLSRIGGGFRVETASSAREALDKVRETRFDLILADLRLPDMSGVALTEAVRALDASTTVVWITAYDCFRFRGEADQLGVYSCLDKPVGMDRIGETVREALCSRHRALGNAKRRPGADEASDQSGWR